MVPAVLEIRRSNSLETKVLSWDVLTNLVAASERCATEVCRAGVVRHLLGHLTVTTTADKARKAACEVITNLCEFESSRQALVDGGIPAAVLAMLNHSSPMVVNAALSALADLALNATVQEQIGGYMARLVQFLYPTQTIGIRLSASLAIGNATDANGANQQRAHEHKAEFHLLNLLKHCNAELTNAQKKSRGELESSSMETDQQQQQSHGHDSNGIEKNAKLQHPSSTSTNTEVLVQEDEKTSEDPMAIEQQHQQQQQPKAVQQSLTSSSSEHETALGTASLQEQSTLEPTANTESSREASGQQGQTGQRATSTDVEGQLLEDPKLAPSTTVPRSSTETRANTSSEPKAEKEEDENAEEQVDLSQGVGFVLNAVESLIAYAPSKEAFAELQLDHTLEDILKNTSVEASHKLAQALIDKLKGKGSCS